MTLKQRRELSRALELNRGLDIGDIGEQRAFLQALLLPAGFAGLACFLIWLFV